MSALVSTLSLTTTLPSTEGYTLDTTITTGFANEYSQDEKFRLWAADETYYDSATHQYVTAYGLRLINTSTNATITLASRTSTSYTYTSLSNFTIGDETFYIASYLKGGNQLAFRVFDDTGAAVITETAVDSGTKIDGVYYDGLGALVLAYNNSTEYATLSFSDPNGPVAVADVATMKEDAKLTVDVLANDTDPNGDKLSITSASLVSGSADVAVVKGKVTVDYTGASLWLDETAQVEIQYVVSDGTHSSTGNLTIEVIDPFNRVTGDDSRQDGDGTSGRDYALLGAGNDRIAARSGSDVIFGEEGRDLVYGEDGNDIAIGGAERDHMSGGSGNDVLVSGEGLDRSSGDDGNDTFIDGAGNDYCFGDAGRDTFYDGAGGDWYTGGEGADTFYFFSSAGTGNVIREFDAQDKLRIDSDAAVGMQILQNTPAANWRPYSVTIEFADGGDIILEFVDKKDAKGSDWYEIGDHSVPTDSHGLY